MPDIRRKFVPDSGTLIWCAKVRSWPKDFILTEGMRKRRLSEEERSCREGVWVWRRMSESANDRGGETYKRDLVWRWENRIDLSSDLKVAQKIEPWLFSVGHAETSHIRVTGIFLLILRPALCSELPVLRMPTVQEKYKLMPMCWLSVFGVYCWRMSLKIAADCENCFVQGLGLTRVRLMRLRLVAVMVTLCYFCREIKGYAPGLTEKITKPVFSEKKERATWRGAEWDG